MENFESLKPIVEAVIVDKNSTVLIVGCGNSEFSEQMYDSGWKNLFNIDISTNVIDSMKVRNKDRDKMNCKHKPNFFRSSYGRYEIIFS